LEEIMAKRRQDNALQFWKRLLQGDRTMLSSSGKDYGQATGQCFAILENRIAGDRTMLFNIGK
jgi:hypothetical protein